MNEKKEHILVIRLGALGDLVFCFQSFHEIRQAHPDAEIALLTRAPFASFARAMPWFDRVIVETHPRFTKIGAWMQLVREIKNFMPTRIYDLQGKKRQTILYGLLGGPFGPAWSGAAPLCRFPRPWPPTPEMSFRDFLAAQLRSASVPEAPSDDLAWLDAPIETFTLPERYVVLIPGCSPDAPNKRWPAQCYAALAQQLHRQGLSCIAVGTSADKEQIAGIKAITPDIIDLSAQTNLFELAGILRRAVGAIGNDTGPIHMAAALGAPTVAIFSGQSSPVWSTPPGPKVSWRQSQNLGDLKTSEVMESFTSLMQKEKVVLLYE